jgi:hypothetical protein
MTQQASSINPQTLDELASRAVLDFGATWHPGWN